MSIKVTQNAFQRQNNQMDHSQSMYQQSVSDPMMRALPSKRLRLEEDPSRAKGEEIITFMSELDKLKLFFPTLSLKEREELLKESDNSICKSVEAMTCRSKGITMAEFQSRNAKIQEQKNNGTLVSKKRKRRDMEEDYSEMSITQSDTPQKFPQTQARHLEEKKESAQNQHQHAFKTQASNQNLANQNSSLPSSQDSSYMSPQSIRQEGTQTQAEIFAERAVSDLMSVGSLDNAKQLLTNLFNQFNVEVCKRKIKEQSNKVSTLQRDNNILKKGILIQNTRHQEAIQKGAQFDELLNHTQNIARELGMVKSQNEALMKQIMSRDPNNYMLSKFNNSFNPDFNGGGPMVQ